MALFAFHSGLLPGASSFLKTPALLMSQHSFCSRTYYTTITTNTNTTTLTTRTRTRPLLTSTSNSNGTSNSNSDTNSNSNTNSNSISNNNSSSNSNSSSSSNNSNSRLLQVRLKINRETTSDTATTTSSLTLKTSTSAPLQNDIKSKNTRENNPTTKKAQITSQRPLGQPESTRRLFSNVSPVDGFKHIPGSLVGTTALVAGTTIGAGILALPAATIESGFLLSTAGLFAAWLYMVTSGLLIAEAAANTMCAIGRSGISILSMIDLTLGKKGATVAGAAYGFLHYAMLVAYMSQAGHVVAHVLSTAGLADLASLMGLSVDAVGTTIFAAIMAAFLYWGPPQLVESVNNVLVVGVIASFFSLVYYSASRFDPSNLLFSNPSTLPAAFPIMTLSLVFHNLVPIVVSQLEGDLPKIRIALMAGSFIPFLMFTVWNAVILGSVPPQVAVSIPHFDPLVYIRHAAPTSLVTSVETFTLLAVATSFVGFLYGLADFFADVLQNNGKEAASRNKAITYALSLLPPLLIALTNPSIFLPALDYSGTFGIMILFGLLPPAMVWKIRYGHKQPQKQKQKQLAHPIHTQPNPHATHNTTHNTSPTEILVPPSVPDYVPGKKTALLAVIAVALTTIVNQVVEKVTHFIQ